MRTATTPTNLVRCVAQCLLLVLDMFTDFSHGIHAGAVYCVCVMRFMLLIDELFETWDCRRLEMDVSLE